MTKYITFINDLLCQLEESDLCCSVYTTPSSPAGYADDLAAATTSKRKTDKVNEIVYNFGNKWRFKFNARKSAVLIYGETKRDNDLNSKNRVFQLVPDRVPEKCEYEHLVVKNSIYDDNESRVEEKISKGRKALNAASSLGFKRNGLSMTACDLIFWAVVVPIVLFGSEIWTLTEKDIDNLMNFQRYAGRRIQRFPKRSPSTTSFFGLGWIRLSTFVLIRKLLFVMTILRMDNLKVINIIFIDRLKVYFDKTERCKVNKYKSPTFDVLNACHKLGLLNIVKDMALGDAPLIGKKRWSNMVWENAWRLDDGYWKSIMTLNSECSLLSRVIGASRYLYWWFLSDKTPWVMKMCETLTKIVCRTSLLKADDARLEGSLFSYRTCTMCDHYTLENIEHIIMQCPAVRIKMYQDIYRVCPRFETLCQEHPGLVLAWLLGRQPDELSFETMEYVWEISGCYVLYDRKRSHRNRVGRAIYQGGMACHTQIPEMLKPYAVKIYYFCLRYDMQYVLQYILKTSLGYFMLRLFYYLLLLS